MRMLLIISTVLICSSYMELHALTSRAVAHFWQKVSTSEDKTKCWPWRGAVNPNGYGAFKPYGLGVQMGAHRFAWISIYGSISEGMNVCHRCDNPTCVNPHHLFEGTQSDNILDCSKKGRLRTLRGERCNLSKLTASQVVEIRSKYTGQWGDLRSLGKQYGVSATTIYNIGQRKAWKHV